MYVVYFKENTIKLINNTSCTMSKKVYEIPQMETVAVNVEKGFSVSDPNAGGHGKLKISRDFSSIEL